MSRRKVGKKRLSRWGKGKLAYIKAMREPENLTDQDLMDYESSLYEAPEEALQPRQPLRERIDVGLEPERAQRVAQNTGKRWAVIKRGTKAEAGRTKNAIVGLGRTTAGLVKRAGGAIIGGTKYVSQTGERYATKLDTEAERTLADVEQSQGVKFKPTWEEQPEEKYGQTVEVEFEEPHPPEVTGEEAEEAYERRRRRKSKRKKPIKRKTKYKKTKYKRRKTKYKKRKAKRKQRKTEYITDQKYYSKSTIRLFKIKIPRRKKRRGRIQWF